MISSNNSVARWCKEMQSGDQEAANLLWQEFFNRLVDYAGRRLRGKSRLIADEEDIALSAFKSFCIGVQRGRFASLTDRDSLWRLLVVITARKAVDLMAYNRRGKRDEARRVRVDSTAAHDDLVAGFVCSNPTPAIEAEMAENLNRAVAALRKPELQQIAILKLDGFTNREIADRLQRGLSTIERKLRTIRGIWEQQG